jgi:hypothetical protein
MRRSLLALALAGGLACYNTTTSPSNPNNPGQLAPPGDLTYQLLPSGDPTRPDGVMLRWTYQPDSRLAAFVVYSRSSSNASWVSRAQTTSNTFHDGGNPDLQYAVTALDASGGESAFSNVVTIDASNQLATPRGLAPINLNSAVQLSWQPNSRQGSAASLFDYYRVYSTSYDLDRNLCDDSRWALEGSTVSEDFISSGLQNGVPFCFAISAISMDGHESEWSQPVAATPRYDAHNVVVYSTKASPDHSGFRFYDPSSNAFGLVEGGSRSDIDFKVMCLSDGSLGIVPVRTGTTVQQIGSIGSLTAVGIAPASGYGTAGVSARIGNGYVFETRLSDGLHYGAIRVSAVTPDYIVFDWAYQSDFGDPELIRVATAH